MGKPTRQSGDRRGKCADARLGSSGGAVALWIAFREPRPQLKGSEPKTFALAICERAADRTCGANFVVQVSAKMRKVGLALWGKYATRLRGVTSNSTSAKGITFSAHLRHDRAAGEAATYGAEPPVACARLPYWSLAAARARRRATRRLVSSAEANLPVSRRWSMHALRRKVPGLPPRRRNFACARIRSQTAGEVIRRRPGREGPREV